MMRRTIQPQAAQRSLMLLERLYPGTTSNHRSVAVEITGPINLPAFREAFKKVINRHEMLRAYVKVTNEDRVFEIYDSADYLDKFTTLNKYIDASGIVSKPKLEDFYTTLKILKEEEFVEKPFDLHNIPLWRSIIVKVDENRYQFSIMFNHIIIDEGSIGVILRELSHFYNLELGQSSQASLDFIPSFAEHDISLSTLEKEERLAYWSEKLKDLNTTNLQTDVPPQQSFRFAGKRIRFKLDSDLIAQLEIIAKSKDSSLNQVMLASLYSLLYRYSGETDICLGITSANRRHKALDSKIAEQMVNCFFNSVPLRLQFDKNVTFLELLSQTRVTLSEALKKQLPLDIVFEEAISPDTKASLLTASPFNCLLVLNRLKPTLTLTGTTASQPVELDFGRCKFPYFGINLDEYPDGSYDCFVEYNTDLFFEETMNRLIGHFKKILQCITEQPSAKISTLPLLLDEEKKLIADFNATTKEPVTQNLVPDYFHECAEAYPDHIALVFHHSNSSIEKLTYRELDIRSSQLANYLIQHGIGPNIPVGISLTRSANLVVAILAVLKAGGAVVTMETEECASLSHKIKDTKIPVVITDSSTASLFSDLTTDIINIDNEKIGHDIAQALPPDKRPALKPTDIAYIMYTSGTSSASETGEKANPKGVVITHGSFANLLNALFDLHLKPNTKVICTALPTFDAIFYDMLAAWTTHGEIHLCFEGGRYSPRVLEEIIAKENINFGVFLPSLLSELNPQLPLEFVISMGAVPHEETMKIWATSRKGRVIMNGLGHTEAGVCTSIHIYKPGTDHTITGQPIRNMQMFIINPENLSICPLGVPGEIYLSGPSLAQGYIGNEKLTNKKFPLLSYNPVDGTFKRLGPSETSETAIRVYATGDYGCYQLTQDKKVEIKFIGRKDRVIKIYGVRVDLDEVEFILRKHPSIKDVVVLSNQENTDLTAYMVPSSTGISPDNLRQHIQEYLTQTLLPSVAHPKTICILPELRLTRNGKIDTRALPVTIPGQSIDKTRPLTELQIRIREIWAHVLKRDVEQISIYHSYKENGGNSLSLARLETELNKKLAFNEYVGINILSKHMTIISLSETLAPLLKSSSALSKLPGDAYRNSDDTVVFFKKKTSQKPEVLQHIPQNTVKKETGGTDTQNHQSQTSLSFKTTGNLV